MSADTRLKLGVALLIVGLIMPAGTLLVAATDWPLAVKTVVSSILLLGFEIMLIPAVDDWSLYVGGPHTLCLDCELRSVLAP